MVIKLCCLDNIDKEGHMCSVQIEGFFSVVSNLLSLKFKDAELVKCTVHCIFLVSKSKHKYHSCNKCFG